MYAIYFSGFQCLRDREIATQQFCEKRIAIHIRFVIFSQSPDSAQFVGQSFINSSVTVVATEGDSN